MKNHVLGTLLVLSLILSGPLSGQQEARLLRFPAIHGDKIAFTYAGDLYIVGASGGLARKVTNDVGFEMFARFSPDGSVLAFTGQYDGNTEVYTMSSDGGVPKRLTYTATLDRDDVSDRMGPNNIVMTWRNKEEIVYRSRRIEANDFIGQLFVASLHGGSPVQLPLPRGGFCSFSPDGKQMVYNRVFREFRTWKRYRGGQADDIWLYDFSTKETVNLTNNPAQDIMPMWIGNTIYFISDRDGRDGVKRLNLYSYDLASKETKQLTYFKDFDVKFPSADQKSIVFENGGFIYRFDLASGVAAKVPISLAEDFAAGRGGVIDVGKSVTDFEISPDGNRALFGARGELFTVPAKNGNTRNLTNTSGVHERNSVWSPDGKWVAYISDATGDNEIYVMPQDAGAPGRQLTKNSDTYKFQILWSPDSKKLLWADKMQRLQFVDVESQKVTLVAQATAFEFSDYCWSPDSKWIAFAKPEEKVMTTIQLYSVEKKEITAVTDGWYSSGDPSFSADGKYLFFVSDRIFNPTYSQTEWNHSYGDMEKIFFVTLSSETKSPFEPKSDEVSIKEDKKEPEKKKEADPKPAVKVTVDGLQQRIGVLPITAAGYRHISSVGDKVYYVRRGSRDEKPKLLLYDLDKQKETELGEYGAYEISADGKKMIVGVDGGYAIVDLPSARIEVKDKLNLSDLKMNLNRTEEWRQIYYEAWRQMRDFFYDPNMHHVDWEGVKKNYEQLLPFVNHRADLTYIIGEMIGELSVGHAYVGGGDMPRPERIRQGLLGAELERDPASKYYRIVRILKGQNWDNTLRSPLTDIGVDAKEGEYILAVNGKPTMEMTDIYESLAGMAGKQVRLKLNASASENGSHETVVIPIADERQLYYYNWVQHNIEIVTKATDGKVGYIHVPDMSSRGLNEFVKYYYPQLRKEALIIDDRGNGGGNVSPMIIERLRREISMIDIARNTSVSVDPGGTMLGPKVALVNEFSASDGDIFAYRFKHYKLGPVIGKRTWGGVVGIRGSLPFVDGGYLNRPEFSRYDVAGKSWIMEGHGVDPDIVVDNDPALEYSGVDEQLNKAIEVIKEEMKKNPVTLPAPPPYPDKSK